MEPRKVLVVDDSRLLHRMYEVMLKGRTIVFASDGAEALRKMGENPDVDLVLLDINMPNMNGIECLAALKKHPIWSTVPVVMVTTEGRDVDAQRALDMGAAGYVTKPFKHEALRGVIAGLRERQP
jgi:two-component system chemotaxis response regulator CheY